MRKHTLKLKNRQGFIGILIACFVVVFLIILVSMGSAADVGSHKGANSTGQMITTQNNSSAPGTNSPIVAPSGPCGQRIVQIASNEVGAFEVKKGDNRGPNNSPTFHGITNSYKNGSGNGLPWCSYFATWVLRNAGDKIPVKPLASAVYKYYNDKGQAFTKASVLSGQNTPQPGDIFVKNLVGSGHIGIVESYSNGILKTIEGNSDDRVKRNTRVLKKANDVAGFGRPLCK